MLGRKWIQRVGPFIAVALAAAGGLIFETITPEIISATIFYVVVVLVGYWFPQPKAALALALLATPLIIIGDWISIPNGPSDWKVLLNRGLAVGVVWLVAAFVWHIRVLEQKLQAGKDRLQFALDAARLGWWEYDPRRRVASVDPRFKEIFDVVADEFPVGDIKKLVHPDDAERFWADRAAAFDPAEANSSAHEYRLPHLDGGLRWIEVCWLAHFEGVGSRVWVESAFATVQDITKRKVAEEGLRESEERLRFIADQAHVGYWHWQVATDRLEWSPIVSQLFGIPPEDPMSYPRFLAALHPDDRERTDRAIHACLMSRGRKDYDIEYRALWPDETVRWIHAKGNATFTDGNPVRMAGLVLDITERKEREEREHLLIREMNHRVKNILTVVDAIAHRTVAESPQDFAGRFSERIRALSANQDLLFRNEWQGVDVEELVRAQLSHFADLIGSRIVVDGPKLRFNTAGAQAIGLALHELATNAGKYGALSTDKGLVDLRWNFSDNAFTMSWTEREGPTVSAPKRCGFGTTVIERMAKSSLGGAVDLSYAPSGLTWCLTCPARNALERRNEDRFSRGSQIEPRPGMDYTTILERLSMARRHVRAGEQNITRQRKVIAERERHGHDSLESKRLLARFEEIQELHIADRDRLEIELAEISK
jgi:PAS domain S-box-containing protein